MARFNRGRTQGLFKRRAAVEDFGARAESLAEKYFFRRLDRLVAVRRFVISWLLLVLLICGCLVGQIRALNGYFQQLKPIPGGIYTEGILGDFTNANPLYANSQVDDTVSHLIFAGLFKYDDSNKLVGDLASGYRLDDSGKVYTVTLRPNLKWQDDQPLTADDVVFTYQTIQNPDAMSVLHAGWQNITVAAKDPQTITFTLPNPLASFPYNMTNGIIPQHLLKSVSADEMRSVSFNTTKPVGAGPFTWSTIQVNGATPETRQSQIALSPSKNYYAGMPKLASFVVHAFHDNDQLVASFKRQELTAASFQSVPSEIASLPNVQVQHFMLSAEDMVFFKESNPVLADAAVRKALVSAVNVPALVSSLGYVTQPVEGPFLNGQLGFDKTLLQPSFNLPAAKSRLDAAGWTVGPNGLRSKGGQPLKFSLYTANSAENMAVAKQLVTAWRSIGVQVSLQAESSEDIQRSISNNHQYDALLYGISIGVDPDVYAYWDSSQSDARSAQLNLSEFKSKVADTALEAGRTRTDPSLRVVKYHPFLQAWQQDTPALGLYQPAYTYVTRGSVYGLTAHTINAETDRFNNVQNWEIRQADVTNE